MKTSLYALILAVLVCAGCTPTHNVRGNFVTQKQLETVTLNEDSASDVIRKLGSPTAQSTFDNTIWYYLGQETQKKGIFDAEIVEEQVLVVTFDKKTGVVTNIDKSDGKRLDLPYEKTKTKTYGNEVTPVQQFLGNLGKFNTPNAQ